MVDAVTVGTLAASVLAMAAEAALKGTVGEAAKEAYQALKTKVATWAKSDLDLLEKEPASEGRQAIVAEVVDRQTEPDQAEVHALSQKLVGALKEISAVGLDVGYLEATEVQLGSISVTGGTGARFQDARVTGTFRTGQIEVRTPSGKA